MRGIAECAAGFEGLVVCFLVGLRWRGSFLNGRLGAMRSSKGENPLGWR